MAKAEEYAGFISCYSRQKLHIDIHFVIVLNTEKNVQAVNWRYPKTYYDYTISISSHDPSKHVTEWEVSSFPINFESDSISVDIPPEGVTTEDGYWRIVCCSPNMITKKQVDSYKPGLVICSIQMKAMPLVDVDKLGWCVYRLNVKGAKDFTSFTISHLLQARQDLIHQKIKPEHGETDEALRLDVKKLKTEVNLLKELVEARVYDPRLSDPPLPSPLVKPTPRSRMPDSAPSLHYEIVESLSAPLIRSEKYYYETSSQSQIQVKQTTQSILKHGEEKPAVVEFRGVEVCAETTVIVTNSSQYFHWKGYGLTLHVPDGCLPADVDQCVINIKASLAGQYEFPRHSHLVSAVYWLRCEPSCKFTKAISVEIEHCAPLENSSKLSIVRSQCTQKQLPYTFKKIGWTFTEQSSYGYIELDSFSGIAVTQTGSEEREYCAGLYYLEKKTMNPEIHFVVTWNTEAHLTVIDKHYKSKGADPGPDFTVSFESDAISLDIPPEGITVEGGWRIIPLTSPPFVTKKEVDNYKPKRRIPSCQIQAFVPQTSTDVVPTLTHQIRLKGVRQSCSANSITISFIPGVVASSIQEVIEVQKSGQEAESNRPPRLKLLLKELNRISSEWENIGVFLEIDDGELQALRREHSSPRDCLREMLRLWLKMVSPPPTWSNIVDVVKDVGDGALADELQQKYCS